LVAVAALGLTVAGTGLAFGTGDGLDAAAAAFHRRPGSQPRVTTTPTPTRTPGHRRGHRRPPVNSPPTSTGAGAAPSGSPTAPSSQTTAPNSSSATTAPSSPTTAPTTPASNAEYTCVQTSEQGRCYYPDDPAITGANGEPYLNQNIWTGARSYKQTLYGASPTNWYVIANANTGYGGVLSYPNVGWDMTGKVDSNSSITSSWTTSMPHDSRMAAWAAYDLWFNDWEDEVMIQTDIAANSYYDCDAVVTATFSGMPWHMCRFGSERVWKPGTDDRHLLNRATGSINIQEILVWMEKHGQLPAGSTWTAGSFGFEPCDTCGTDAKLAVTDFSWHVF
jgi:hypothetical protein